MTWLINNKDWIFSGIGIFIITIVWNFFRKKNNSNKQIQKSGKNSKNYQAGGNITIGKEDD